MNKRMIAILSAGVLAGATVVAVPSIALASQDNRPAPASDLGSMMSDGAFREDMKSFMSEMMSDAELKTQMRSMMTDVMKDMDMGADGMDMGGSGSGDMSGMDMNDMQGDKSDAPTPSESVTP